MTTKDKLIRRLGWYYPTERFNVFLFTTCALFIAFYFPLQDTIFLLYGLVLSTFILFQGQHYWKVKLFRLTGKFIDVQQNLRFFEKCKQWNLRLIYCMPLVLGLQFYSVGWTWAGDNLIGWGLLANFLAVLEHINYYFRQLMIDNRADFTYLIRYRRLKVSSLFKDLKERAF